MTFAEFVLGLAFAHKRWRNADCALLVSRGTFVDFIGEQSASFSYDTPIVNLLQHLPVRMSRSATLVCTYCPNEMDLGMACMRQVSSVIYVSGGVAQEVLLSDSSGVKPARALQRAWNARVSFRFARSDRPQFRQDMEAPWGVQAPWANPAWTSPWYNSLEENLLQSNPLKAFRSYNNTATNSNVVYSGRPRGDIDRAQEVLKTGLAQAEKSAGNVLSPTLSERLFMGTAMAIVGRSLERSKVKLDEGHNVGAVMTDKQGRIIGWGLNLSKLNGTFHAETAMILAYLRRHNTHVLPEKCRIYTTLKPCHMCAGFIAHVAKGAHVIYGQDDPKITHSALDDDRGDETVQQASQMHVTTNLLPHRPNMTLSEALADLISASGLAAIPFLYSDQAARFFSSLRGKPQLLRAAVKQFSELPSTAQTVGIRPLGHESPISWNMMRSRVTQMSRTSEGLDLAVSPSNVPLRGGAMVPLGQPMTNTLKSMKKSGRFEYGLVNPSRTLEGLDLALGHADPLQRKKVAEAGSQTIEQLLKTMDQIQLFLQTLQAKKLISAT